MLHNHDNTSLRISSFIVLTFVLRIQGWAQLTVSVSTDKPVYNCGENIVFTGTVTNHTDTVVEVEQAYQGPVYGLSFDDIDLSWTILPANVVYSYKPHVSVNWLFTIDGSRLGLPNKEGPHYLICPFYWKYMGNEIIYRGRDSVAIVQPAYYGGRLQVAYSINTPRPEIESLLDSMNATVVSSDTSAISENVYDWWQTSGFILDSLVAKYTGDARLRSIAPDRSVTGPSSPVTDIITLKDRSVNCRLSQNYPNPFSISGQTRNSRTIISFSIPASSSGSLRIYDVLGREVAELLSGEFSAGEHSVRWDASGVSSGTYFYRLQAGTYIETKKILLMK